MQELPISISEFEELRAKRCLYIDKTRHVYTLLTKNRRSFLSRPRRFGKSLLLSTLTAALQGKKELFQGLWMARSNYAWKPYGIIRLDFSTFSTESLQEFKESFLDAFIDILETERLPPKSTTNLNVLVRHVVKHLYTKYQAVAILIDEYDYPILHTLHNRKLAISIRSTLKSFSCVIKALAKEIQFVFVTGVSAFSKSGLSSGLNNLDNLTLNKEFSDICGYTDREIGLYFIKHLKHWARCKEISYTKLRKELKTWYNGYCFKEGTLSIYSPFSFTCAVHIQEVNNFWFESATPQFLLDEIQKLERKEESSFLSGKDFVGSMDTLQTFEIEDIPLIALLFQMGYLTLDTYDPTSQIYRLKYPNLEVKTSLHKHLLITLTRMAKWPFDCLLVHLVSALMQENLDDFLEIIQRIFSKIPYQIRKEDESFYHSTLQALFISANIPSHAEYSTPEGRADIVLELPSLIYIFELKVQHSAKKALHQIEQKKYYEPFLHSKRPVRAVGLSFAKLNRKTKSPAITYATKKFVETKQSKKR